MGYYSFLHIPEVASAEFQPVLREDETSWFNQNRLTIPSKPLCYLIHVEQKQPVAYWILIYLKQVENLY